MKPRPEPRQAAAELRNGEHSKREEFQALKFPPPRQAVPQNPARLQPMWAFAHKGTMLPFRIGKMLQLASHVHAEWMANRPIGRIVS